MTKLEWTKVLRYVKNTNTPYYCGFIASVLYAAKENHNIKTSSVQEFYEYYSFNEIKHWFNFLYDSNVLKVRTLKK